MIKLSTLTNILLLSVSSSLYAEEVTETQATPSKKVEQLAETDTKESETSKLTAENALKQAQLTKELADLHARVKTLKLEKELLTEELALAELKEKQANHKADQEFTEQLKELSRTADLAKAKADKANNDLKLKQAEWKMQTSQLEAEMHVLKVEKQRDAYANAKPVYLENPLQDNGSLIISDRRIEMNGPVTYKTADHITTRINYFNNKDTDKPIFIVIDASPGGSVMAGYRILKAMEGSRAPVYVVVKSFAASMAASICTLAEKSYAYPNAIILHHQISSTIFYANLNLTEQREFYEESQEWWKRLAKPIASKMGISTDEFIKKMYTNASSGDWMEFGEQAKELKWVDHIVERIHETSLLVNPDADTKVKKSPHGLTESTDEHGEPCVYLPRLIAKDCYFLYSRDNYYRMR